jgi:hypothetical protein
MIFSEKPVPTFRDHALAVSFQEVVHSALTGNAEVARHKRFAEDRMDSHQNARLTPKVERPWCGR